jgi:hypothetical protein
MRMLVVILLTIGIASPALAQGSSCDLAAAEKKLTGAAKTGFIRQCEAAAKAKMTRATKENKKAAMASAGQDGHCGNNAADL